MRPRTIGIIVHSTRSGYRGDDRFEKEYEATIAFFERPGTPASAHRVIGYREGQHALCVPDELMAWHAQEDNMAWLGVELAQALRTDPFSDWQYEELARLCREWASKFGFPLDRAHIVGHEETAQGKRNGKSDPGAMFDWGRLMRLLE